MQVTAQPGQTVQEGVEPDEPAVRRVAEAEPIIHTGYHKTGSTWLQFRVLHNEAAGFYSPWKHRDYIQRFVIANPFTDRVTDIRRFLAEGFAEAERRKLVPALTCEMLSGAMWSGKYNSKDTADLLAEVCPRGRVVLVVREQRSMIRSAYKHRVRSGRCRAGIERFLAPSKPDTGWEPMFQLGYLEYHWLIGHYHKLFGADRVLVLPYELLRKDAAAFAGAVSRFAGAQGEIATDSEVVNKGRSALTIAIQRRLNPWMPTDPAQGRIGRRYKLGQALLANLDRVLPESLKKRSESQLAARIERCLGDHYADSNRKTEALTGLDLRSYGYI